MFPAVISNPNKLLFTFVSANSGEIYKTEKELDRVSDLLKDKKELEHLIRKGDTESLVIHLTSFYAQTKNIGGNIGSGFIYHSNYTNWNPLLSNFKSVWSLLHRNYFSNGIVKAY